MFSISVLLDQWMPCIDKGDLVSSLFLVLRKAFNVIDQTILIEKILTVPKWQTFLSL